MEVISTSKEIQAIIEELKNNKKTVGFVPTMGYLHNAHVSLVKRSKKENDISIASIYVNPAQFGPGEDLDMYPRDLDRDCKLLENEGVDFVFVPKDNEEIYPEGKKIDLPKLPKYFYIFEGTRPGDFHRGIAQACFQLFKFIPATKTYFGRKDYQQTLLIDWLIKRLNLDIKLVVCPIIRETSGLAMSSRNEYLSDEQKEKAIILQNTLKQTQKWIVEGITDVEELEHKMKEMISSEPLVDRINYAGIRGIKMEEILKVENEAVALVGASFGRAKLLDNKILKV